MSDKQKLAAPIQAMVDAKNEQFHMRDSKEFYARIKRMMARWAAELAALTEQPDLDAPLNYINELEREFNVEGIALPKPDAICADDAYALPFRWKNADDCDRVTRILSELMKRGMK